MNAQRIVNYVLVESALIHLVISDVNALMDIILAQKTDAKVSLTFDPFKCDL